MKSGIIDKNDIEVKEGDVICIPYVDPVGNIYPDDVDKEHTVVFKYGCFGVQTLIGFVPLFNMMKTKSGKYISNVGNITVYTEEYHFWVK